ncbi:chromate transporter [Azorhizobium doebereinerae]|uniref:chromate transporter n=1 Tax=Azorhizobium doebereinerae TaxID=281091 RepID=UPI0004189E5B|nr:chromate transporter [Azorhizobium doebereinerae]
MSDVSAPACEPEGTASLPPPSVLGIFLVFLSIGATSFGGGVVAYLRSSLVGRQRWVDDETFLELLSICQSLPGLNASNMAILVGDRLRGTAGAAAALVGICLPGGLMMVVAAIAYGATHSRGNVVDGMLHGVSAAAVGMVLAVSVQLGLKTLTRYADLVFVALTIIGVEVLKQSVLVVLAVVGAMAIFWYRPGGAPHKGDLFAGLLPAKAPRPPQGPQSSDDGKGGGPGGAA